MKTDAVAAAVSEALRLVNRSRAEWPEEAVEHAARRAAELAREECATSYKAGVIKRVLREYGVLRPMSAKACHRDAYIEDVARAINARITEAIRAGSGGDHE